MALFQKYRPKTFDDFIGNEDVVDALKTILKRPRENIQHAFLFTGPSGCGKTTLGRIVASMLGCDIDKGYFGGFDEKNSADYRGIDAIRDILKDLNPGFFSEPCKVFLLDECHQMTTDAQSALLKALEEPPSNVYFILCTTEPQKLLQTVKSRCVIFDLQPVETKEIIHLLRVVHRKEWKKVPPEVLECIALKSMGSCRDAIQILDMIIDLETEKLMEWLEKNQTRQPSCPSNKSRLREISEQRQKIIDYLSNHSEPVQHNKLVVEMQQQGVGKGIDTILRKMVKDDSIQKVGYGLYASKEYKVHDG